MKKSLQKLILVGIIACSSIAAQGQSYFHLSQYMMYQPFINNAAIGSYSGMGGALLYKKQWAGLDGAPEIQAFGFSSRIKKTNSHIGLTVVHDKIGVNNNFDISGIYAYNIKITRESKLALSLSAVASMQQSNFAEVDIIDGQDPIFAANTKTYVLPNTQFSAYYYSKKFYAGISLPKLLHSSIAIDNNGESSGKTTFDFYQMHYYINAGYSFELNSTTDLNISTLFKQVAGAPLQMDLNAQFLLNKKIGIAASYRTSQELVGILSYKFTTMFSLSYSYDYSLSVLSPYQSGTHEIMLLFRMPVEKSNLMLEPIRF